MITVAAMAAAMTAVAAIYQLVTAFTAPPPGPRKPALTVSQWWGRATKRPPGAAGLRRDLIWVGTIAAGIGVFFLTGYVIAIVAVPLAVIAGPKLFGQAPTTDLPVLEALDRWVRAIASAQQVGRDVPSSLRSARNSTPPLLAAEVQAFLDRIDRGWTPADALQRMADDLDNPEVDAVLASLKMALTRSEGIHATLIQISEAIQERIKVTRIIEVERNKPRTTARIITIITMIMIGGTLLLAPEYMAPYQTGVGQILLAVIAGFYVLSLLLMYRSTRTRPRARILTINTDTTTAPAASRRI